MKYRCKKCGYIEECENLEDFYVCPICGASKDMMVVDNDEKTKLVYIDDNNPGISRTIEKCVDCGILLYKRVLSTRLYFLLQSYQTRSGLPYFCR